MFLKITRSVKTPIPKGERGEEGSATDDLLVPEINQTLVFWAELRKSLFRILCESYDFFVPQAPVVQTMDSAIRRINHYPVDK